MLGGRHKIRMSGVASGEADITHFEDSEKVFMRFQLAHVLIIDRSVPQIAKKRVSGQRKAHLHLSGS